MRTKREVGVATGFVLTFLAGASAIVVTNHADPQTRVVVSAVSPTESVESSSTVRSTSSEFVSTPTTSPSAPPQRTTTAPPPTVREPKLLLAGDSIVHSESWNTNPATINGTAYTNVTQNGVGCAGCPTTRSLEWDLGRKFNQFTATIGQLDKSQGTDATVRFEVDGDGRTLFSKELAYGTSVPVDLDVGGVLRLKLVLAIVKNPTTYVIAGFAEPTAAA